MYLGISEEVVSLVLICFIQIKQSPIYYVSRVLKGIELNYVKIEKTSYDVLITARKFRPYFLSHNIDVLTNQPFERKLKRLNQLRRILN